MKWITMAPNGISITLQIDNFVDKTFFHRQVIEDQVIAEKYKDVFRPYVAPLNQAQKPQKLTEVPKVPQVAEENKDEETVEEKQILTEVPKVPEVEPENDKVSYDEITKKELTKLCEDRGIEVPKYANKSELISLLEKG